MRLSVIIPVYNTEHTLDRCVESVLRQYDDMEVILVDDGSPDRGGAMCDEWGSRDSRIVVLHKENGGLSDARNAALDVASGEYVTFVDSDDYLSPGTYAPLMRQLAEHQEVDILEYGMHLTKGGGRDITFPDKVYASARDYWEESRAWQHCYMCNKIFRLRLFAVTRFQKGRAYEDALLYPSLLHESRCVATAHRGSYQYVCGDESITSTITAANIKQLLEAEMRGRDMMGTTLFSRNGWHLHLCMLYRQIDIYRLSGEVILPWPGIKIVCWLHGLLKRE